MVKASNPHREKIVFSASDNRHNDLSTELRFWEFMDVAHWASKRQIQIGVRGFEEKRYTTLERFLNRNERNKKLRVAWRRHSKYGTVKVYAKPQTTRNFNLENYEGLYHGYCCTECLIRFLVSKEGKPYPQRAFRGYGRIPEFAIKYENGKILLVEFSTNHDTEYSGKLRGKIFGYADCLPQIEKDFGAEAIVVFILEVEREEVKRKVERFVGANGSDASLFANGGSPRTPFFFTDYKTFLDVPLGRALQEPIYIYKDGKEYPLSDD